MKWVITSDDIPIHISDSYDNSYRAMSASLSLEYNKAGSLTFSISSFHSVRKLGISCLNKLKSIVRVYRDDTMIWKGRVLDYSRDFYGTVSYRCEGWLAVLNDSMALPDGREYIIESPATRFNSLITQHNEQVDTEKKLTPHIKGFGPVEEDIGDGEWGYIDDDTHSTVQYGSYGSDVRLAQEYLNRLKYPLIVDGIFGDSTQNAVMEFQRANSLNVTGVVDEYTWSALEASVETVLNKIAMNPRFQIPSYETTFDYIQQNLISASLIGGHIWMEDSDIYYYAEGYEYFSPQVIEFGKNMLDFSENVDASNIVTVLLPEGADGLRLTPSQYMEHAAGIQQYGRIVRHETFSDITTVEDLRSEAIKKLAEYQEAETITISAIDLSLIDADVQAIDIGNFVRVLSPPHGIDKYYMCTAITIDVCNPGNSRYTLGINKETFTEQNVKMRKAILNMGGTNESIDGGSGSDELNDGE